MQNLKTNNVIPIDVKNYIFIQEHSKYFRSPNSVRVPSFFILLKKKSDLNINSSPNVSIISISNWG
jgi:hypothetical protein